MEVTLNFISGVKTVVYFLPGNIAMVTSPGPEQVLFKKTDQKS